jgi:hypothetical protein
MNIRAMTPNDVAEISWLHHKYYSEFAFPSFGSMLNAFVIEDEEGIIMAGGVEQVAEAMLVTNKEKSRIKIGKALVEAQQCSAFTCKAHGIKDMYAFVRDDEYAEHLLQHGFVNCDRALLMRIP